MQGSGTQPLCGAPLPQAGFDSCLFPTAYVARKKMTSQYFKTVSANLFLAPWQLKISAFRCEFYLVATSRRESLVKADRTLSSCPFLQRGSYDANGKFNFYKSLCEKRQQAEKTGYVHKRCFPRRRYVIGAYLINTFLALFKECTQAYLIFWRFRRNEDGRQKDQGPHSQIRQPLAEAPAMRHQR